MNTKPLFSTAAAIGGLLTAVHCASAQNWTLTSAPSNHWLSVAASADGRKLVAAGGQGSYAGEMDTSNDSGITWISNSMPDQPWSGWSAVASSADGSQLAAVSYGNGIYVSTDSGTNWALTSAPSDLWVCIACSADGRKLVAASSGDYPDYDGRIYSSSDSGATWTLTSAPAGIWSCIASSADGTKLVAATSNGGQLLGPSNVGATSGTIFTSADSGATWIPRNPTRSGWISVACSADGTKLAAAAYGWFYSMRRVCTSMDSGATWTETGDLAGHLALSADGSMLVLAQPYQAPGLIWASRDFGVTWTTSSVSAGPVSAVASSADGNLLVAAGTWIHTSRSTPAPFLKVASAGGNLLLSWLVPSMNFNLQGNSTLNSVNWTNVEAAPALVLTNLQYQFIVPLASGPNFYRLAGP